MLATFTLYSELDELVKEQLRPFLFGEIPEGSWAYRKLRGDLSEIHPRLPSTVRLVIEGNEIDFGIWERISFDLKRLAAKIDSPIAPVNNRCNVSVPGLGLLVINKVILADDCCTDELQRLLDQGWRILAICPQPDQRRPDYILGKTDADTTL